jgi:hypothetical protein
MMGFHLLKRYSDINSLNIPRPGSQIIHLDEEFLTACKLITTMPNISKHHHGYTVTYDSRSHWRVITQMYGSVWPRVLPYCILNTILAGLIHWLDSSDKISLAISDKGHSFMNLMVAFLVVSRVTISIGRYDEARGYLAAMYRECRELIHNMVVLSGHNTDLRAKEWRNEVAYHTCLLLRVAMGVIDYPEQYKNVWELDELDPQERVDMRKYIYYDTGSPQNALRWAHNSRTEYEENMRVPIRLAFLLRKQIRRQRMDLGESLVPQLELKLMASVDSFMGGYYGMLKFLTTPFPFVSLTVAIAMESQGRRRSLTLALPAIGTNGENLSLFLRLHSARGATF